MLLRRSARRHRGDGSGVHSPAIAGIKLCVSLRVGSTGGVLAQTRQLREWFESSRQRAESQLLPRVAAPDSVLPFQLSHTADDLILRAVHQQLQFLLERPFVGFVDGRPNLGGIEKVVILWCGALEPLHDAGVIRRSLGKTL